MAVFFDPLNIFSEQTSVAGSGLFGGFTVYQQPLPAPILTTSKPIVLSGTTRVYSASLSGAGDPGLESIAEIWGSGTLFLGGDVIQTEFQATGGDFFGAAASAAKTPVGLFFIIALLVWYVYARKK